MAAAAEMLVSQGSGSESRFTVITPYSFKYFVLRLMWTSWLPEPWLPPHCFGMGAGTASTREKTPRVSIRRLNLKPAASRSVFLRGNDSSFWPTPWHFANPYHLLILRQGPVCNCMLQILNTSHHSLQDVDPSTNKAQGR